MPMFKKSGGKIFAVQFNKAGVEAVLCRNLEATGTLPDGTSR